MTKCVLNLQHIRKQNKFPWPTHVCAILALLAIVPSCWRLPKIDPATQKKLTSQTPSILEHLPTCYDESLRSAEAWKVEECDDNCCLFQSFRVLWRLDVIIGRHRLPDVQFWSGITCPVCTMHGGSFALIPVALIQVDNTWWWRRYG